MFKNRSIRIKMVVMYIAVACLVIPMVIISFVFMQYLVGADTAAAGESVGLFGFFYIIYIVICFLVLLAVGRGLVKKIVFPLRDLEKASQKIALGDVDVELEYEQEDEIGNLTKEFRKMAEAVKMQTQILSIMAEGDYTVFIPVRSEKDIMNMSINQLIENNNQMLLQVSNSISQVSVGARQIAEGATTLAQGSAEQASSVEDLSSFMTKISTMTNDNASMTEQATELAKKIMQNAEEGSRQMDGMSAAVRDINNASQNISKVMKAIDDIAFQTNILALNAAVEAARAGVHGKGFAVVSDEVRSLAVKSAEAARETSEMISDSMTKAALGNKLADETVASLAEIVAGINESSRIISEIARYSEDQAKGIVHINSSIDKVAMVVSQNSATAEESAAASEEMSGQTALLEELILQFKLKKDEGY